MIGWTDLPVEPPLAPLAVFTATLSLVDSAALVSRAALGPAVAIAGACRQGVLGHLATRDVEQGGLLIGRAFARPDDLYTVALVVVERHVPAPRFDGSRTFLRMESDVWEAARALLGGGERIIGWYHSHPNLGAFFSAVDRRTQGAFFTLPCSVGWVVDPVRGEEKVFLGAGAEEIAASALLELSAPGRGALDPPVLADAAPLPEATRDS